MKQNYHRFIMDSKEKLKWSKTRSITDKNIKCCYNFLYTDLNQYDSDEPKHEAFRFSQYLLKQDLVETPLFHTSFS